MSSTDDRTEPPEGDIPTGHTEVDFVQPDLSSPDKSGASKHFKAVFTLLVLLALVILAAPELIFGPEENPEEGSIVSNIGKDVLDEASAKK